LPYRQNFPIPAVIDPPKTCLQIEIPDHPDWKAVISGLLFELTYWFNWERTGDTSGAQCAAVWKQVYNSIDWSKMSCCCDEPAIIKRINPTTGVVEQSSDGGITWDPVPNGIPSYIVQPVPPVTSGVAANKCDAAANLAGQVNAWIDQVSTDFTTAVNLLEFGIAVLEAILAAVLIILSAGALTPLEALVLPTIGAALGAAWAAGKAAFDAYWTTDIKHEILCDAYCTIGDDGSFTDAQFSAFWNKINAGLPAGPPKMLFLGFLSSVGTAGVNAMAASGLSSDSDCSDCPSCEPGCANEWSVYPQTGDHFGEILEQTPTYIIAQTTNVNTNGIWYIYLITDDINNCCYINSMDIIEGTPALNVSACGNALGTGISAFIGPGCVNQLQPQSSGPFKVKFNIDACP
jgi:hypothetical protein